ncbi:hypothetical protein J6590_027169 [Homalodisca vitripennis]|nr:hypothetical protein J6590_027169 [Homalodisca vitripennis]
MAAILFGPFPPFPLTALSIIRGSKLKTAARVRVAWGHGWLLAAVDWAGSQEMAMIRSARLLEDKIIVREIRRVNYALTMRVKEVGRKQFRGRGAAQRSHGT